MNLAIQQAAFSRLRDIAGGDVHRVEMAIIAATKDADGAAPTVQAVADKLAEGNP